MAIKIILLSAILGIIALLVFDSIPSNQDFNNCLSQISINYTRITNIVRQRQWTGDRFCNAAHAQMLVDQACVQNVMDSRITARYIFWISPNRVNINKVLREYNRQCWDQQVPLYELDLIADDSPSGL
ncbi:hypothetical protein HY469_01960 [Candidatus Roizmanbacteria bacterium]|nr:hypothetical protein [Candidatus Roizmanbacteria bacterium]